MASAALSMRLASARRMASGSASTGGSPGSRSRFTVMPSRRPANSASASSATLFMSQARGCDAGNCASAENWSTRVRSVPTQLRITSLHLRMMLGDSASARGRGACRSVRPKARWA